MVGNDIIDLKLAKTQSNWQRKGFLEKVFTDDEQTIINNAKNPFIQVWLFWSMKEAAYKCYTQKQKKRFFAPKKIHCELISKTTGTITINQKRYFSRSAITNSYIHTYTVNNYSDTPKTELFFIDDNDQSLAVKNKLTSYLSNDIKLKKDEFGVPKLYKHSKELPLSVSITHHGNFGAFTILSNA